MAAILDRLGRQLWNILVDCTCRWFKQSVAAHLVLVRKRAADDLLDTRVGEKPNAMTDELQNKIDIAFKRGVRFRIVTDKYNGFEVQRKTRWWPFWRQPRINTSETLGEAKDWLRRYLEKDGATVVIVEEFKPSGQK